MSEDTSLVTVQDVDLAPRMVMTVDQAIARLKEFQRFVEAVMVPNVDYGKIPGTDKPTLLKPGAEKLCEMYGLAPLVDITNRIEDWQNGFFHYECKCRLVSKRSGITVAEGIGSCNSKEKRYADRWVFGSEIPNGVDKESLPKREFKKRDGGTFVKYLWKNEDVYTLVNTIKKMAKKRALIDATLSATRSSGMFTQDVEDWVEGEYREAKPEGAQGNGTQKPTPPPESQRPTAAKGDPERDELKKRWGELWNQAMDLKMKPTVTLNPTSASIDEMRAAVNKLADEIAAFTELTAIAWLRKKDQGKLI